MKQGISREIFIEKHPQNSDDDDNYAPDNRNSERRSMFSLSDLSLTHYLKMMLFSFEFNLNNYLEDINPENARQIIQAVKIAPGSKPVQLVFCHYLLKRQFSIALFMALLFPLPYTLLFILLSKFIIPYLSLPALGIIILIGIRCSIIALLGRYCLHFPNDKYNWIIYVSTMFIGLMFRNNYVFLLLYAIAIFMAYYVKEDAREDNQAGQKAKSEEELKIKSSFKEIQGMPETFPTFAICFLVGMVVTCWVLAKYYDYEHFYFLQQFIIVGMINCSLQTAAFFPYLALQLFSSKNGLHPGDLLGLGFILPGPHIKSFFLLLGQSSYQVIGMAYVTMYLPSILLMCIYLGYREYFYSVLWSNISKSIQAVSNGLILITIIELISEQKCNFNVVCYTSVVLLCVTKLYKLRQIYASLLGIFLVFSRATVLYLYKDNDYNKFVCFIQK